MEYWSRLLKEKLIKARTEHHVTFAEAGFDSGRPASDKISRKNKNIASTPVGEGDKSKEIPTTILTQSHKRTQSAPNRMYFMDGNCDQLEGVDCH